MTDQQITKKPAAKQTLQELQTADIATADTESAETEEPISNSSTTAAASTASTASAASAASKPQRRGIGSLIGGFFSGLGYQFARMRRFLRRGRIPDYPVIVLDGELVERTPQMPWWQQLLPNRKPPMSLEVLHDGLKKIAYEPKTKGVVFYLKSPAFGLTQAQSLLMLFDRFRAWDADQRNAGNSPKQVIVHIEDGSTSAYLAACGADQIYMTPLTDWRVLGLRLGPLFLKETFDKLGVEFDVVRIAPWKSAPDQYNRTSMTKESEEQYNWLIDSLYETISTTISQRRGVEIEQVQALIDDAPLNAAEALAANLIDGIYYEDELPNALSWGTEPATLKPASDCIGIMLRKRGRRVPQSVGIISLSGAIVPGKSRDVPVPLPIMGSEQIGSSTVQQLVRAAREDEGVGAVVVHVDSPGGSALASDIMWRELVLLDQEKPVVIYMGDVAASGGYYLAAPGRKIVAQPATLTGSIGVFVVKPTTKDAFAKVGAKRQIIHRGANSGLYGDDERWTKAQVEKVDRSMKYMYHEFKERVAEGRKLDIDSLDPICQGRVWTGEQALHHGLVDDLGDIHTAVEHACQLAELPTDGSVSLVNIDGPRNQLLAEPMSATEEALGLTSFYELRHLLTAITRGDWSELLGADEYWMIADGLPRIR